MDLFEAIFKRRDTRHFKDEKVPEEVIEKALNAAHHGPSVGLSQPTRFHFTHDLRVRTEIFKLFERADIRAQETILDEKQLEKYQNLKLQSIIDAPIGMIVTTDYSVLQDFTIGVVGNAHALQWSSVCAVQNFWLSLTEDGYSFGWVSILDLEGFHDLLNIPSHQIPLGYFCIGKPSTDYGGIPMLEKLNWKENNSKPVVSEISFENLSSRNSANFSTSSAYPYSEKVDKSNEASFQNTKQNCHDFKIEIENKFRQKMMPHGGLGLLQNTIHAICEILNTSNPTFKNPCLLLYVSDHGIAQTGLVNKYPQGLTYELLKNYLSGTGAINQVCNSNKIKLEIIDCGVNAVIQNDLKTENFHAYSVGFGTQNYLETPAMTANQLNKCFEFGKLIAVDLAKNSNVVLLGECGIGNSSAASLLTSAILKCEISEIIGSGAGQSEAGLIQKIKTLHNVQKRHKPKTIEEMIQCFGGFELATMASSILKLHDEKKVILVDGFICSVAVLIAFELNPRSINNCIFCTESKEIGQQRIFDYLKVKPILNLGLGIGEGTGAAMAYSLITNALKIFNQTKEF